MKVNKTLEFTTGNKPDVCTAL